jgi:hypothetical protein
MLLILQLVDSRELFAVVGLEDVVKRSCVVLAKMLEEFVVGNLS